jgi:two-component system, LytTR family, sensor kinase
VSLRALVIAIQIGYFYNMWRAHDRIGFNDKWIMLIMIPLTAFLIPIVFFGARIGRQPVYVWQMFLSALFTTTIIWIGCRYIMIWARRRFPQFPGIKKRILIQSAIMLVYDLIVTNLLCNVILGFCGLNDMRHYPNLSQMDLVINSNNATLFCTIALGAIYESKYLNRTLESFEEKERLKRESLHAQFNALKTQVNPHFLFNNLNTLVSLIPENPQQAEAFVQQLSKVYRHILEVKDEKAIPLRDELDMLNAYAFLMKTRFGDNLAIDITVPEEKLSHTIVPLSLQLLMENAIKHNIVSLSKPLKIMIYTANGSLVVHNNLQKKRQHEESTGIGLNNIRNRYKLLGNAEVVVSESDNSFTVSIPLIPRSA